MLSGCNSLSTIIQKPVGPPVQYIQDCPEPEMERPVTNGALVNYIVSARQSLRECNLDKAALRGWAAALPKETDGSIK